MRHAPHWVIATGVVLVLMAAVLGVIALLGPDRQEARPVDPSTSETPAETGR